MLDFHCAPVGNFEKSNSYHISEGVELSPLKEGLQGICLFITALPFGMFSLISCLLFSFIWFTCSELIYFKFYFSVFLLLSACCD